LRILIIDDEPDQLATLALLLGESGHQVEVATNPLYALTLARTFSPQFVFVDIGLPYMDGHEAGRRLKERFAAARIYAITGRSDDDTRRKSEEMRFDGHLVKPVDFALIERLLAEASNP